MIVRLVRLKFPPEHVQTFLDVSYLDSKNSKNYLKISRKNISKVTSLEVFSKRFFTYFHYILYIFAITCL